MGTNALPSLLGMVGYLPLRENTHTHGRAYVKGPACHAFQQAQPPCSPGFYGADCALSLGADGKPQLLEGQGYQPRSRAPKIYVYELPPDLNNLR